MRNTVLSYLLLPLFAGLAFSVNAAPAEGPMTQPVAAMSQKSTGPALVNLNQADAATLQKELTGIGKAKAEAIVAYREANGPFATVDELLEIKGIGNALLERNRDKLSVE
ncbi:ComEA family DNA-binding protein [Pseudomonas promysalinigenes]|uniref:ComEA family DNA-binding protein n=1 Tax=Pseudomonas TaxID=286 RepID=UPI001644FAE1|nr:MULTISPECIES: ComEA family DNA-binding protein [Pseudomonas]QXI34987.1 ComEA family DNA-binding protein [Pseudomonas promysalinigenes]